MSKHYSKKRRLKYVFIALACTASFSLTGLAAACKTDENNDDNNKTTSKEDIQLLKNGNFEFFTVPDQKDGEPAPEYLINTPNSWTHDGTTSYTMSGIIGTSEEAWNKLTAKDLADRLDANNALDSSASDYKETHIDFNGMKSNDLLYKDSYGALKFGTIKEEKDGDKTKYYIDEGDAKTEIYKDGDNYYYDSEHKKPVSKDFITNPGTHLNIQGKKGDRYYLDEKGNKVTVYENEDGEYFLKKDKEEYSQPVGHVLMLHNYTNSNHNGIAQNYTSVNVDLPANTSAEISVWVKTSDLLYSNGKYGVDGQDHGANITVSHTVGGSSLDDFKITSINTQKLIADGKVEDKYNGWVEYTVYVNSCNFASSTITLKLGLGENDSPVEGYAFFDDVTVTKYIDLEANNNEETPCTYPENKDKIINDGAYCTLTSGADDKIFVADTYERPTNNSTVKTDRFSKDFHYLLDLASESEYNPVSLNGATAGLTVDSDNYVSSLKGNFDKTGLGAPEAPAKTKLPEDLKNLKIDGNTGDGIDTSGDLLALISANGKIENHQYADKLNEVLATNKLPNAADSKTLVLFSAKGAAYTASFDYTLKAEAKDEYQIISFWVKTSDMGGSAAATVKITEKDNDTNTANITLDSTGIVTDIDDNNKDIYDGWVQCFFFVHNDSNSDEDITLKVEFSFGNTTLNGTTVTSYKSGWAALTNMQAISVDEDVYAYTGSGEHTATLTIAEDEKKYSSKFDEVAEGQTIELENGFADPSTYDGFNGESSKIVNNGVISPYDSKNNNDNAGLLNKDYAENYQEQKWYQDLLGKFGVNYSAGTAVDNWNEVFGSKSVQPLVIINSLRNDYVQLKNPSEDNYTTYWIYDEDNDEYRHPTSDDKFDAENVKYYTTKDVLNYGFISNQKTVSADGYTTITVRVKVSAGAVAYIYLVDTSDSSVLGFNAPSYTYWYDEDGNVLKDKIDEKASLAEQRENVLYTLQSNGLYKDKDGNLRANIWNYTKLYNKNITYYTKDGKFTIDELDDSVTYYEDEACTKIADHYLVTKDGDKIFEVKDNGKYFYIVNGETQKDEVKAFEKEYARYTYEGLDEKYIEVVENTNGEWVTVNFVIHAGSESKNYRLELWSGERENAFTDGNEAGGAVIFDYSYTSITSNNLLSKYENDIIKTYQYILADNDLLDGTVSSDWNIEDYENYIEKNKDKISESDVKTYEKTKETYTAHYYSFSLYDSANFVPFNKDVANESATGYDYSIDSYEEALAYLAITDGNDRTVFIDYSTIDQNVTLDLGTDEDEEDGEEEEEEKDTTNVWLLVSSIVLVVALLFAIIAIFVKDALKKTRRNKVFGKNNYSANRANRYIRRLGIKKEEIEEVDAPAAEPETFEAEETVEPEQIENVEENNETPDENSDN